MDALDAPLLAPLAKQRRMSRAAERGAPAPTHESLANIVVDRDQMPRRVRYLNDPPDLCRKLGRYALVGVDLDYPITETGLDSGMAARPFPLPAAFDKAPREATGDLAGAIAAAVENDDDFIGKAETGETIGEPTLLVTGDDESRKPRSGHAATLPTERHSSVTAASAASTDKPSISVSVVRWSKPGPNIASGGSVERT